MKLFEGSTVTHRVLSWSDEDESAVDRDQVIKIGVDTGWGEYIGMFGFEKLELFADAITLPYREKINELEHEIVALRKLALELQSTAIKYQDDIVRGLGE